MTEEFRNLRQTVTDAQAALDRAQQNLDRAVRMCPHQWTEPKYAPIVREAHTVPASGSGSDYQPAFQVSREEKPRWTRTCAVCGLVEETTQVRKVTQEIPNFR